MRWEVAPLGFVADVRPSGVDKLSVEGEIPVRLCNYVDVYYANTITEDRDFMVATATLDEVRRFQLRRDDVALTKDSETAEDIGVPTWVGEDIPGVLLGYHTTLVRPRTLDGRFLYYVLSTHPTKAYFTRSARGVTRFALRQQDVAGTPVPMPPVEAQHRIADYLDSETARIEALITKNELAAALIHERLQTTIADAFGGAVVENSAGVPIGLTGMPTAPLFAVAEVQSGLTLNAANEVDGAPEWAYLRVANVQDGHLALDSVKTVRVPASMASRHRLQNGDVLMTEGGDPDKLGRGTVFRDEVQNCLHQNHVFAARPNQSALLPDYLALATRSPYARMYFEKTASKTTGIASTSATKIGAWRVPLPDIDTQQRIVQQVNRANDLTGETIAKLSRQRELLHERRQALITAAVTGEIEV